MTETGEGRETDEPLRHVRGDGLAGNAGRNTGMARYEALSAGTVGAEKLWMGQTRIAPGFVSSAHHHGAAEFGVYVVSGNPVFVFADGEREARIGTEPGDYVFVPPFVPHREENPGPVEAVLVIARDIQEGVVVNLPSLRAPVERGGDGGDGDGGGGAAQPGQST